MIPVIKNDPWVHADALLRPWLLSRPRVHLETAPMNLRQTVELLRAAHLRRPSLRNLLLETRSAESRRVKTQPCQAHSLDSQFTEII